MIDGGRLEEIVVVRRDELPQLVDEEAEADAAEDRPDAPHDGVEEREEEDDRDQHPGPAPQQMRDVQAVSSELRIVRQPELGPDDEDGAGPADDHRVEQRPDVVGTHPDARETCPEDPAKHAAILLPD